MLTLGLKGLEAATWWYADRPVAPSSCLHANKLFPHAVFFSRTCIERAVAYEKQKFQGHLSLLPPTFHTVITANRQNGVREKSFSSLDTDDRSNFLGT